MCIYILVGVYIYILVYIYIHVLLVIHLLSPESFAWSQPVSNSCIYSPASAYHPRTCESGLIGLSISFCIIKIIHSALRLGGGER